ncbi:hypothetical protein MASR2M78_04640 [Treponema sp.]
MAAEKAGVLGELIRAGFRILESACGPCIGMGFAPKSKGVSLRSFNRNFEGRSGTKDAQVYLVSPETAAAAALAGHIVDPSSIILSRADTREAVRAGLAAAGDDMLIPPIPQEEAITVEIERGPNIKPCPIPVAIENRVELPVIIKTGDDITTDDIMPAGAKVLPLRSNIPEISKYVFTRLDADFWKKAEKASSSMIVGGSNYGQGSSREHAALAPMYLGIKVILVKSFARIHKANLINYGIIPLVFDTASDYDLIETEDILYLDGLHSFLETGSSKSGEGKIEIINTTKNTRFKASLELDERSRKILRAGGLVPYAKAGGV